MDSKKKGSRAAMPDMDWSQVHETVIMLELSAVQIDAALRDSGSSFDVLSHTFLAMAGYLRSQQEALQSLPVMPEGVGMRSNLISNGEQILGMMQQTIISFQFYDRLGQRLTHVCEGLESLSGLVNDRERIFDPSAWVELQQKIKMHYSTKEELAMFTAVMTGTPISEAVAKFLADTVEKSSEDVELF